MSDDAVNLLFSALDYAIENAKISAEGFTPFSMTLKVDDTRGLTRYVSGDGSNLAESLEAGRQRLKTVDQGTTCVALAWDGYLSHQGVRFEAVYAEAYELGQPSGVQLAQRYIRENDDLHATGKPILVGQPEPLVEVIRMSQ